MYRLKVVHLHVAPLRERKDDVRPLVEFMVERTGREVTFTDDAMRALIRYRWPGNVRELQNVVEQMAWMVPGGVVGLEHLPPGIRQADPAPVTPMRERRRQIADELYDGLLTGTYSFWNHIHRLFLDRDITRHDLRQLVRRGLATTGGNYRAMLKLFGMPDHDYKRFLNFLAAHDCAVDFRPFRSGQAQQADAIWNPLATVRARVNEQSS
jgi:DNA-binding NtrC family response regulator